MLSCFKFRSTGAWCMTGPEGSALPSFLVDIVRPTGLRGCELKGEGLRYFEVNTARH